MQAYMYIEGHRDIMSYSNGNSYKHTFMHTYMHEFIHTNTPPIIPLTTNKMGK